MEIAAETESVGRTFVELTYFHDVAAIFGEDADLLAAACPPADNPRLLALIERPRGTIDFSAISLVLAY